MQNYELLNQNQFAKQLIYKHYTYFSHMDI